MKIKCFFAIILCLIGVPLLLVNVSAYSLLGDINLDGKVTVADARTVLRISAGLDEIQKYNFYFADVNKDNKISVADARQILRTSAGLENSIEHEHNNVDATCVLPKTCSACGLPQGNALGHDLVDGVCTRCGLNNVVNNNSEKTEVYNGITVTKLPYSSNGLIINSLSFSGTKVTINVTNNTGYAIDNISYFPYKCYDSNGTILKTGNVYLENMNYGESCNVYFYAENDTSKIIFGEASAKKE